MQMACGPWQRCNFSEKVILKRAARCLQVLPTPRHNSIVTLQYGLMQVQTEIVRTTPLEVAVAEDPTSPLVELHETALTLASWDPDAIASRFEVLSDAVSAASEAGQQLNNHIQTPTRANGAAA